MNFKLFITLTTLFSLLFCATQIDILSFSDSETKETLAYWTPERFAEAQPMEMLLRKEKIKDEVTADPDTEPVTPESLYAIRPYAQCGRVFFNYQGRPASCTGSSTGGSAVITAGHCIAMNGVYHKNWVFVPQFNNGSKPHGVFVANKVMVFDSWLKNMDMARDVGFAVTEKVEGQTLSEKIGYLEAGVCKVDDSEAITAVGYPGNIGNAQKMIRTNDKLRMKVPGFFPWKPEPIGIRSMMGPGSSGGPWIMKFKLGEKQERNCVCSVNSFGLRFTYYVFGPQFDDEVLRMRKIAISS